MYKKEEEVQQQQQQQQGHSPLLDFLLTLNTRVVKILGILVDTFSCADVLYYGCWDVLY
jgi:hypothetical protein